jgi:hypothetical protein
LVPALEGQRVEALGEHVRTLEAAVKSALDELGVPGEGYPAPVANAVEILRAALGDTPPRAPSPIDRLHGQVDYPPLPVDGEPVDAFDVVESPQPETGK